MILEGFYQYPHKAAKEAACIELSGIGSTVALSFQGHRQYFELSDITVSEALGSIPLFLTFPDGSRFVAKDDKPLVEWLSERKPVSWAHRLESHKGAILLALLGTVFSLYAYVQILLPWGAKMIATTSIPNSVQAQVGESTLSMLSVSGFKESKLSSERQKALQGLFQQIQPVKVRNASLPVKLVFRRSSSGPNAFTLADGTIVLTDSLAEMSSNDELAAVLLHEIGHHNHKHVMQMIVQSSMLTVASAWIIGDAGGVSDSVINSGVAILSLSYSRNMEREADEFAIIEMEKQQRPLAAMASVFQKLDEEGAGEKPKRRFSLFSLLSSHPDMGERLETIRKAQQQQRLN